MLRFLYFLKHFKIMMRMSNEIFLFFGGRIFYRRSDKSDPRPRTSISRDYLRTSDWKKIKYSPRSFVFFRFDNNKASRLIGRLETSSPSGRRRQWRRRSSKRRGLITVLEAPVQWFQKLLRDCIPFLKK